jgi:16S rRNA (adenine1518-N6/adenine1519-N6)-dimethyltransferase
MLQKKSLGQHFLNNPHYLERLADAAAVSAGDTVLEIGPGEGTLTAVLLARGARVVAVEKDTRLIPILKEKFKSEKFVLYEEDILDTNISKLKLPKQYRVVANIPYYITGALLKKFLSAKRQPSTLVFLVQKEVAERIARSKKESILSLSIKAYGKPRYIKTVPRGAFSPPPAVDSAILLVENISRNNFKNAKHEKRFFELVKAGFAHKRKLLVRNLEPLLGKQHSHILQNVGMSENTRAEDVPLEKWLELSGA